MNAATPGQAERFALSERLVQAAAEIKNCRSVTVVCHSCEEQITAVLAAADDYAKAAQDARPARADEFARMKVKLSALIASMEDTVRPRPDDLYDSMSREFDDGAVHVTAVTLRQLRAILDETALGVPAEPKAAPELAAAMTETRLTRERLDAIRNYCDAKIRMVGMVDGKGVARKVIAIIDKPEGK